MAKHSRIDLPGPKIFGFFDERPTRIYTRTEIAQFLAGNREAWDLTRSITLESFIEFLAQAGKLDIVRFRFPNQVVVRYVWGKAPALELVHSIKPSGYLTHYTAMYLHGLTEQIPKTIYLNFEQRARGGGGILTQARIDQAFQRKCRVSKNVATFGDQRVCLLNGQNTGQLGVIDLETGDGAHTRVTNIERTLIDAVVRPIYAGGVFEVSRAFGIARGRFSVNRLVATLRKLNYTYPYYQAIGFYLDRAGGYRQSQIELLSQFDMEFDFYLAHDIKDTDYVQRWRLFVPKGF